MRLTIANYVTWTAVMLVRNVITVHHIDNCMLLPSELGPDWYKVPRPVPPGSNGEPAHEQSYVHMPCAATTVFEVGVCGCTNLMSFLFTTMNRRSMLNSELKEEDTIDTHDIIKQVESTATPRPPVGSVLINTRTGEVRKCPFRASSRGQRWYLTREPNDRWRHMECAAGTVFEKRKCTCIHGLIESREPMKPDDANIIILEGDFVRMPSDKTISQSLGISVSDIDFAADKHEHDVPFWRRHGLSKSDQTKEERGTFRGQSDVEVTLHAHVQDDHHMHDDIGKLDIGKDRISDAHRNMLMKLKRGPMSRSTSKMAPLVLDSTLHNVFYIEHKMHSDVNDVSLIMHAGSFDTNKPDISKTETNMKEQDILKVLDEISTHIEALQSDKEENTGHEKHSGDIGLTGETKNTAGSFGAIVGDSFDEIFYQTECSKKPLPDRGPQYFLLQIMDLGYIPFTCHGNTVYDDKLCACMPSPDDTRYDETTFPTKECTKRAVPNLGQQFFQDHLLGVGYIPYVCHGNRIFDDRMCACV